MCAPTCQHSSHKRPTPLGDLRKLYRKLWLAWFRSNLVRWVRSWFISRRLLREMYSEAWRRGWWHGDKMCLTFLRRDDGLLCAGVPREERQGVWAKGDEMCRYCTLDYEIRKTLPYS